MANYWGERFKRLKTAEMRKAERANADLARVYRETLRQLRAEVEQWYDRFAKENKISLAEARRILDNRELKEFKMTLADFIKEAKRLDLDPAHIRMLENASMRVRLTRSQEIYLKTAQYVEKLAKSQGWQLSGLMREVYTDSVYKTAYETQKVTGFENFRAVRERQIEEAISKPWAPDGADFSSRVWKNKTQLINSLQTDITQSLMTGTSTAQLSEKIAARFNTSYNQAYRLVETETAYIQERAMLDTYDELGLEQYQICAVLDSKTSEICQDLDGKVFDRKDAKPGITMPPFHCHCRSTTVPYIEGLLDDGGRVARDPETGKTVEIPDMTYKEWKERYVDKQTKAAEDGKIKEKKELTEKERVDVLLASYRRIKGEHSAAADIKATNPNFAESSRRKDKLYTHNCQRCVNVYELRRRGYDVTAAPLDLSGNDTLPIMDHEKGWANVYIGGKDALVPCISNSRAGVVRKVMAQMRSWGVGARAIVRVRWVNGGGHVFIAENRPEGIKFIDPQPGQLDVVFYFNGVKVNGTYLLRIDDKEFSELIDKCVAKKE